MVLETELEKVRVDLNNAKQKLRSLLTENEDIYHVPSMVSLIRSLRSVQEAIEQLDLGVEQLANEGNEYGKEKDSDEKPKEPN
jgi:flagellar biosynthesis chaperone FliJ